MNSINAATENNHNNVTALPSNPKPQTSKEVIAANVQLLIEQLEAGHSEGLTAYLMAIVSSITTRSATSLRSHGKSQTQPALQVYMRGTN